MNRLSLILAVALAACGGTKSHEDAGGDLATASNDMAHDLSADMAGADAAMPIVVPQPTGTKISTTGVYLYGVTATDALLIVVDPTSAAASAMDPTTGALTAIATADGGVIVVGDVVFVGHDVDANGNSGLGVWTKANGYHDLGVTGSQVYSAFTDGTNIGYFAAASTSSTTFLETADVYIDNVQHSAPHKVVSQLVVGNGIGNGQFVGGKAIVGHAPAGSTDGVGTITSYDSAGTGTDLLTNVGTFLSFNAANTLLEASGTNAQIYDFTTSTVITLPSDVSTVAFSTDTSSAYAATTADTLVKVSWTGTTATEGTPLVGSGVDNAVAVSSDNAYLLYTGTYDMTTFTTDLAIVPIATPAAARSLASTGVNYSSFSSSGDYVLWVENQDENYVGQLFVASSASGMGTQLTATASSYVALSDSKLLVADDFAMDSTSSYYTLEKFDLTTPAATPTRLETNVNGYVVSPDSSTLYFSITAGQYAGVYKTSL